MEPILHEGNSKEPALDFNAETGIIKISGRSIPENAIEFYRKLLDWLSAYCAKPQSTTKMEFRFEYMNTSSSKCLWDILKKMENFSNSGNKVVINWYHDEDDEDMMEMGEDLQDVIRIPINIIEVNE